MSLEKQNPWRSKTYLEWVKSLPCSHCFAPAPSNPHHIKGVGHFSGASLKAPDQYVMPLCTPCHAAMHNSHDYWERQWEYTARTLGKAIADGVLTIAEKG